MKTAAIILMGGNARRLGGIAKHDITIEGESCLRRVSRRLASSADDIFLSLASPLKPGNSGSDYGIIYDEKTAKSLDGVLNALLTIFRWGKSSHYDFIVTTTADTPFLPESYVEKLRANYVITNRGTSPIVSVSKNRLHGLHALWPAPVLPDATSLIESGGPLSITQLHENLGSIEHVFEDQDYDPFFNINTPDDLMKAEKIASLHGI